MLTLPIKKKWFDMIASGEKKEEYRDNTEYYNTRFLPHYNKEMTIRLRNGYSKYAPTLECLVYVDWHTGREEWGAVPNVRYYVLKILSVKDITERKPNNGE